MQTGVTNLSCHCLIILPRLTGAIIEYSIIRNSLAPIENKQRHQRRLVDKSLMVCRGEIVESLWSCVMYALQIKFGSL